MKTHFIIAIDGPAGAGKSTVARKLADKLKFAYLETGATYRAFAIHYLDDLNSPVSCVDSRRLARKLRTFSLKTDGQSQWWLNGREITSRLYHESISRAASLLAKESFVRETMVAWQRNFASGKNLVAEGRDTTTVVFPEADLKIFLTASQTVRAKRRLKEIRGSQANATLSQIEASLAARDSQDIKREHAPLRRAEDAFVLDTSKLTIPEVVEKIEALWKSKKKSLLSSEKKL